MSTKARKTNEHLAKALRMLTAPPLLVTCALILFWKLENGVFDTWTSLCLGIAVLGILPALSYPASHLLSRFKHAGREGQRRLAFIVTTISYFVGFVGALAGYASPKMSLIYITYFISVVFLGFLNVALHEKASGHACASAAALFFTVLYTNALALLPCLGIFALSSWASISLKRHTPRNITTGTLTFFAALAASALLFCPLYGGLPF